MVEWGEGGGDDGTTRNIFGETALHFAARAGNGEAVEFLMGEREGGRREWEGQGGGVTVLTGESALHYVMRRRVGKGGRRVGGVEGVVEGVVGRFGEGEMERGDVGGVTPRELGGGGEEEEGQVCFFSYLMIVF